MNARLSSICISACLVLCGARTSSAQFPQSVTCQFEKIASAELDPSGKTIAGTESSTGEIVISNLNSDTPFASGNIGVVRLRVLGKSQDTIWLAEITGNELAGIITLFFKSNVVMYTKHETLRTVNGDKPFGFVEIGKFRPLR